jgi:phosphoglycolate phosphatase
MRYRLAVFDFDGTLVDSAFPIVAAANAALADVGLPPRPPPDVLAWVGLPLEEVLEKLAPGGPVERLARLYREHFDRVAPGRMPLFDGVREALRSLRAAGLDLAIASGRRREGIEEILGVHGLLGEFAFVAGGACTARGKPDPEMLHLVLGRLGVAAGDAVMVGDTTWDIRMGRAAGVDTCAVTYGSHSADDLSREDPTHVVHAPRDLPGALG